MVNPSINDLVRFMQIGGLMYKRLDNGFLQLRVYAPGCVLPVAVLDLPYNEARDMVVGIAQLLELPLN